MPEPTITCPHCGKKIPLTKALSHQIRENLQKEFESKLKAREDELDKREISLNRDSKQLEKDRESISKELEERLKAERSKIKRDALKEAKRSYELEIKDLEAQNVEKEKLIAEARQVELDARKKLRELDERSKRLDLEVEKRLDKDRRDIEKKALEIFTEEHRLKDAEKDKQMADMRRQIDDLKRKSEQGSARIQGEVLELDLEDFLRRQFPIDEVFPVPTGIRGADVLQRVNTRSGQNCGTIIWESKRTKSWNNNWISKLKEDQREVKAEVAVIVSEALPKDVDSFSQIDGVWITKPSLAANLAEVLRAGMIEVCQTKLLSVSKDEKMEVLYSYLSGPEFRQKVEAIVEAFTAMQRDLEQEKRALTRIWKKREKQIERVITNTIGMYGDMQGIIGSSMPKIKMLELETEPEEEEE